MPVDRYLELAAKVDVFFATVHKRYADAMECAPGCSDCCRVRFSVTGVEAAVIERHLDTVDETGRARLAERARVGDPKSCAALSDSGRCEIYEARPLVCRSHGVPIRSRKDRVSLPVIDACFKNFGGDVTLDDIDPDAVLDQETLSTVLIALDLAHAEANGLERGGRVDLAELFLSRCQQ